VTNPLPPEELQRTVAVWQPDANHVVYEMKDWTVFDVWVFDNSGILKISRFNQGMDGRWSMVPYYCL